MEYPVEVSDDILRSWFMETTKGNYDSNTIIVPKYLLDENPDLMMSFNETDGFGSFDAKASARLLTCIRYEMMNVNSVSLLFDNRERAMIFKLSLK